MGGDPAGASLDKRVKRDCITIVGVPRPRKNGKERLGVST